MISLFFITNQPDIAAFAVGHGVTHIFVDLETLGKFERQGHRDTLISRHNVADIGSIRSALDQGDDIHEHKAELLVRINPWHDQSGAEIDAAISNGADWIMLPMYRTVQEVEWCCAHVAGRARCIPLVETIDAVECLEAVAALPDVDMLFIGLNDLHMEMKRDFMFELLTDGTVEHLANIIKKSGKPFGFGGIARIGEGMVAAEQILGEHLRLGSSAVILSRTFHRHSQSMHDLQDNIDFGHEVERLRAMEQAMHSWTPRQFLDNREALAQATGKIVAELRERREKNL
jgi:2-keto-3-deoxy-L-rhamnonate aldolase RhmA